MKKNAKHVKNIRNRLDFENVEKFMCLKNFEK